MNFFKRAATSIIRRPGKTIILLLLVFILGSVIAGAISVEGAISNTDANLRRNMQPIASIGFNDVAWSESIDWDNFDWDTDEDPWLSRPILTPEDVRAIGRLDYINDYDYMITGWAQSFELVRYDGEHQFSWREEGMPEHMNLRGTSGTSMVKIEEGIIDLVQGNQFSESDLIPGSERSAAMISTGFAEANNLSLGSVFEVYQIVFVPHEDETFFWNWNEELFLDENIHELVGLEFEVVGLFDIALDPDMDSNSQEYHDRLRTLNNIYVPNWAIEDINRRTAASNRESWNTVAFDPPHGILDEEQVTTVFPLFIIDDPANMDDFREAAAHLLPEFHQIEDLSNAFDDIASSMETMQTIANWILYASIIATLLILSLLITLFLRDRRYEMGVYLALGEKKGKIISQILMEVLVTSFVAITLSVFVGNIISGTISRNMLMNELTAEVDDPWGGWRHEWSVFDEIGIPTTTLSTAEMMDQFDVSLTPGTIGLFYIVGLSAVILSTIAPVMYVVTLNPKKVLM